MIDDNNNTVIAQDIEALDATMMKKQQQEYHKLPTGFTYVDDLIPNIQIDIKYSYDDNFTGNKVPGYDANRAIGTIQAVKALKNIEAELNTLGLGLKIFDFYRPARACAHFKAWCLNGNDDAAAKRRFYPSIDKADLLKGYIAEYSSHSRGSTVDLTIINLETEEELDMGTEFDFLGEESHTNSNLVAKPAQLNRQLLVDVMNKHGFNNYSKEWWHFSLRDEPFKLTPQHHFDFVVR